MNDSSRGRQGPSQGPAPPCSSSRALWRAHATECSSTRCRFSLSSRCAYRRSRQQTILSCSGRGSLPLRRPQRQQMPRRSPSRDGCCRSPLPRPCTSTHGQRPDVRQRCRRIPPSLRTTTPRDPPDGSRRRRGGHGFRRHPVGSERARAPDVPLGTRYRCASVSGDQSLDPPASCGVSVEGTDPPAALACSHASRLMTEPSDACHSISPLSGFSIH